jgi:hypothetical protein
MTMRAWADNNIQCLEYVNHTVKGSKSMSLENKAFHFEERDVRKASSCKQFKVSMKTYIFLIYFQSNILIAEPVDQYIGKVSE